LYFLVENYRPRLYIELKESQVYQIFCLTYIIIEYISWKVKKFFSLIQKEKPYTPLEYRASFAITDLPQSR